MAQVLQLKISGLKTNPSQFGAKEGALKIAKNIVIDRTNTAGSRRGFTTYGYDLDETGSGTFEGFFNYDNTLFVKYGDTIYRDNGSGGWTAVPGAFTAPDTEILTRSVENNGSFFFTTDVGLYKMESTTATPALGGIPRAIGIDLSLNADDSGFFTAERQIAYRVVWGKKDVNGVVSLGYPSERAEIANTSDQTGEYTDTRDVDITVYIPSGITTDYFFQVYRSGFSANATTVANDELQLVYENNPTTTEIATGSISFTDNTPDTLRGATIYTAPSQEGILQANELPPLAKDITMYKNYALFANTRTRHFLSLTLLSVGGSDGLQIGDIIKVAGVDYVASAAQDHTVGQFLLDTTGTAAENIRNTAQSLVQVINRYNANTIVYAYYTSGFDELPGQMLIQRRNLADTSFAVSFDAANTGDDDGRMWNPVLSSSDTNSGNETKTNRIYVSKVQQVDAVPQLQYFDADGDGGNIKRILSLRDSAWILKDNGEIWRLVGETVNDFQLIRFDSTTKIIGARTAVPFNNQIMLFSEQGVVAVSDSGVSVKSWDIEDQLKVYFDSSTFPGAAFGVSYESDRKYLLYTGVETFVYNSFTNAWTKWDTIYEAGFVNPTDDKLYWGKNDGFVYKERKNFEKWDYADREYDVTVKTSSGTTVLVDGSFTEISQVSSGQTLKQNSTSDVVSSATENSSDSNYASTSDGNLDSPGGTNLETGNNSFVPCLLLLVAKYTCYLTAGNYVWSTGQQNATYIGDDLNYLQRPDPGGGPTVAGTTAVYWDKYDAANPWTVFASSSFDGLQRVTFPKNVTGDELGGYIEFYYDNAAWVYAFNNTTSKIVLSLGGDIYKDSIAPENLVITYDGYTGPAGSATPDINNYYAVLTTENTLTWLNEAATLNDFIDCELQWLEIYADNPGFMKKWKELTVFFRDMNDKFDLIFSNNFDDVNKITQEITPTYIGAGWGSLPWGSGPWGGNASGNQENRCYFPIQFMRAIWQNVKVQTNRAFTNFTLNAISVIFEAMDTEFTKDAST